MNFYKIKYWYHDSDFEETYLIKWTYDPNSMDYRDADGSWYGPFKTFTQCKNDAINYHKGDIITAKAALLITQNIKYSEVK